MVLKLTQCVQLYNQEFRIKQRYMQISKILFKQTDAVRCFSFKFAFSFCRHVAGLNAGRARNISEWREKNGPLVNREQLKLVKGMGPKSYQQCAGFIRINPQTLNRYTPISIWTPIKKAQKHIFLRFFTCWLRLIYWKKNNGNCTYTLIWSVTNQLKKKLFKKHI